MAWQNRTPICGPVYKMQAKFNRDPKYSMWEAKGSSHNENEVFETKRRTHFVVCSHLMQCMFFFKLQYRTCISQSWYEYIVLLKLCAQTVVRVFRKTVTVQCNAGFHETTV